jgi:hypothetical protein
LESLKKLNKDQLNGYLAFAYPAEVIQDLKCHKFVFCENVVLFSYPGPEVFLGLANAKCEKTREEKGKTSGEFVSDSWFG